MRPRTWRRSGYYFFLVAVDTPIAVQIQLFGDVTIDPATGQLTGRFTKAKRNTDPTRCSPACPTTDACQLVPTQMCVDALHPRRLGRSGSSPTTSRTPGTRPPAFSFEATGCAIDQGASTSAFATAPVDVEVSSPMVTLRNAALSKLVHAGELTGPPPRDGLSLTAYAMLLSAPSTAAAGTGNLTRTVHRPEPGPPRACPRPEQRKRDGYLTGPRMSGTWWSHACDRERPRDP